MTRTDGCTTNRVRDRRRQKRRQKKDSGNDDDDDGSGGGGGDHQESRHPKESRQKSTSLVDAAQRALFL